ncbi:heavy metal-associated isoprenylated plant protein 8-like [Salvia splendens]|uniref:heavy metal-associated isoprenylated plant protein 8-like n=1 Tax=Salvia splendens TaxID=180675 RepID=UPI001C269061|nr:heavy metal-associated isoprenylated plant protein 8-like [Salvia splendens]
MSCVATNNQNGNNNQEGVIVLGVYIHCEGCANEVLNHLRGFQDVEGVEIDAKNHKVRVKGANADPIKVSERLRIKSGKHVELISPQKQDKKEEEKKPEPTVSEVVLKVYIHCEACANEVKHCILKMEGVQTVNPDVAKNEVTVKGTMDPKKLVEFISKRGGRHAEILKETDLNKNDKNDANLNDIHQLVFAPQLFSDENPNACSLM